MSFCPLICLPVSFHFGNLLDAGCVTAAFKRSRKPRTHDIGYIVLGCRARTEREYVCVVVLSSESRDLFRPCDRSAHTRNLVRSDGHSGAGTANQQSLLNSSV